MCGIIALLSKSSDVRKKLLDGLKMLQNRGYDSCGGIMFDKNLESWFWKKASSGCSDTLESRALMHDAMNLLNEAVEKCPTSSIYRGGFFQTRWATHGAKTDANAHPHFDQEKRFFVVHNGIISNYNRLKERLKQKGYIFTSETDTEVVPHLVTDCLKTCQERKQPVSMFQVWKTVIAELEGTWSLVMCDILHPDRLYVAKNGSPLLMAFSDDNSDIWFSSERSGFELYVRKYIIDIPDRTIMECRRGLRGNWTINTTSDYFSKCLHSYLSASLEESTELDQDIEIREMKEALFLPENFQVLKPTPYPYHYWTELEISEQPDKLWEALNCGGRLYMQDGNWKVKLGGLDSKSHRLKKVKHVILTGCGTSYHSCLFALPLFRQISGLVTVQAIDASEFVLKDLPQDNSESIAVVIVSQSGETKDCQRVIEAIGDMSIITIGVVNTVGSWIARESSCGIYLNAGREVGVASTKSFTSQAMVLSLLSLWFAQEHEKSIVKWAPLLCGLSLHFKNEMEHMGKWVKKVIPLVKDQSNMFLLGRGFSHAICLEGALKLKELTYQNAEGYPGGALKHGPFALIDSKAQTPVFLHLWNGPNYTVMLSALEQVVSRGANAIVLHNNSAQKDMLQNLFPKVLFYCIDCPDEWSCAAVSVLAYQLLAVNLCLEKGLNPDYPRNLAKVVSVDG